MERAKTSPCRWRGAEESTSTDAGRAHVNEEGEDKPMSMERAKEPASTDGEGTRANGRQRSPRQRTADEPTSPLRWRGRRQARVNGDGQKISPWRRTAYEPTSMERAKEPASTDGGRAHDDGVAEE